MFRDYLRSAFRNMRRHRLHAVINVGGLTLGFAATAFILIFIAHETSYDEHHEDAERFYRVAVTRSQPNELVRSATTPRPLADAIDDQLSDVERATRISKERAEQVLVRVDGRSFFEDRFFFADPSVFDVFSLPLIRGNSSTALKAPFSVVLTESTAQRLFGPTDPIGRSILIRMRGDGDLFEYKVSGVTRDVPETSHFHFDFLASYLDHPTVGEPDDQSNWVGLNVYTYLLLRPGTDPSRVAAKIDDVAAPGLAAQVEENLGLTLDEFESAGHRFEYFLQPLTDIHLRSDLRNEIEPNGDVANVIMFGVIAAFILGLACVNFIHLVTAQSLSRMKAICVRKMLGADRGELVRRYLIEALVYTVTAAGLAAVILAAVESPLETLAGRPLATGPITWPWITIWAIAAPVAVGVVAGLIPAMYLSRFGTAAALRGRGAAGRADLSALRGGLVAFQFAVSGALIVCTLIMGRQMEYVHQARLGFDKEHVVVIDGAEILAERMDAFRRRLKSVRGVTDVTNAQAVPGRDLTEMIVRSRTAPAGDAITAASVTVGPDYASTLGLRIVDGRDLSDELASDSMAVLLNTSAAAALGMESAGGMIVADGREYQVIGIVEDYHFTSLKHGVDPLVIFGPDRWNQARPNFLVPVRIQPTYREHALRDIEGIWNEFVSGQPFVYSFLDDDFDRQYRSEQRTRSLFRAFSLLAILLACLGLFGLTAVAVQQRTKEIGIRKVLGASIPDILSALSARFVGLVVVGFVAAAPVAYLLMQRWLEDFAYRMRIGPGVFVEAAVILLLVALSTIAYHVLRAALANPVESLQHE